MCYGYGCQFEIRSGKNSGECGHKKSNGPKPCEFEDPEEYEDAKEKYKDDREYKYDLWQDHEEERIRNY